MQHIQTINSAHIDSIFNELILLEPDGRQWPYVFLPWRSHLDFLRVFRPRVPTSQAQRYLDIAKIMYIIFGYSHRPCWVKY